MHQFPKSLRQEFRVFKKLNSPAKIQDFIDKLPINFEPGGETCRSPRMVLKRNEAHCLEGALLAAAALWYHGKPPLLLELRTADADDPHVVALFRRAGRWGAVSKTNHAVLRYRDPVYNTPRELAMSYFNEYFLDSGTKTLRSYSAPFNLLQYKDAWLTAEKDVWHISDAIIDSPHHEILPKNNSHLLRRADPIEIQAGKLVEWKNPKRAHHGRIPRP